VLYRAELGAMAAAHAVTTGPVRGTIAADERRVYWVSDRSLLAIDGDAEALVPTLVATLPSDTQGLGAVHASASAVYVTYASTKLIPSTTGLLRLDKSLGTITPALQEIGDATSAVFTDCTVVWSDGFSLWRRPLPP
jgi:hypothetical protein